MTPDEKKRLIGLANQDQESAEIAAIWSETPTDIKAAILHWIAEEDVDAATQYLADCPPEWMRFLQQCALAGLRGAVIGTN